MVLSLLGGSSEAAMGAAQRPVWRGKEPKNTGARSARARTRGQNPLVYLIILEAGGDSHLEISVIPMLAHILYPREYSHGARVWQGFVAILSM